jgi:hypothetical protein
MPAFAPVLRLEAEDGGNVGELAGVEREDYATIGVVVDMVRDEDVMGVLVGARGMMVVDEPMSLYHRWWRPL